MENRKLQIVGVLVLGLVLGLLLGGNGRDETSDSMEADSATEWTCSMHPQIRQSEPGSCPICGMELIPVVAGRSGGGTSDGPYVHTLSPEAAALAGVETTPVRMAAPRKETVLTGRVAVDERRKETITATVPGRIERLYVDFTGQEVKKGQKLASIYAPELVTAQQELLEAAKAKHVSPALYAAAREKLRLWRITDAQVDAIERTGEVNAEFDVLAEASGTVLRRRVAAGDYVTRGAVLFDIADLSRVWILLDAYESDLAMLRIGSQVRFETAAAPGKTFTSKVTFVDPVIDAQKRTASVRAEADNPSALLRPDVFVRARVTTASQDTAAQLMIPKTAILWTGMRSVVYVRLPGAEPRFEMREVTLGPRAGSHYVVQDGVREGELVVARGAFAVDAASQLSGRYSMMNRPGSPGADVPSAVRDGIAEIVRRYFDLKNALVASDLDGAKERVAAVRAASEAVPSGEDPELSARLRRVNAGLDAVAASEDLDGAAAAFATLSGALIAVVDAYSPTLDRTYVQYCPMASGDAGAYWLSEVEEIRNPYFGESMLRCGETVRMVGGAPQPAAMPAGHRH